jgi:SHS2 domain-containing protein
MYRWIEHPSELELHVEAATDTEAVVDATRALSELLTGDRAPATAGAEAVIREVAVQADDRATLLAAWLEELVLLAETEGAIPEHVFFEVLDQHGIRARVEARTGDPPRLVKAVTYHRLRFDETENGFEATVVLDVSGPTSPERGS